jgi:hypothetical protein
MYWDWENIHSHTVTCDLAIRIEKLGDGEIVERGFCWLYRPDGDDGWVEATLENNDGVIIAETFTDKGFSATVAGLIPASRYTFSAYVKVRVGDYERVFYDTGMGTSTNGLNYQLDILEKTGTSCKLEGYTYDEKLDGISLKSTLQIGESSIIAKETGCMVISNFRESDIAYGGQGAPLVCFADDKWFRRPNENFAIQNIGGISNITVVSDACDTFGFDNGWNVRGTLKVANAMRGTITIP